MEEVMEFLAKLKVRVPSCSQILKSMIELTTIIPHSNSNVDKEVCPLCEGTKTSKTSFLRKCPKCKGTGKRLK